LTKVESKGGIAAGNDRARRLLGGMEMRREGWKDLIGSLVPILAVAHEHDPDPARPPPIAAERQALCSSTTGISALIESFS